MILHGAMGRGWTSFLAIFWWIKKRLSPMDGYSIHAGESIEVNGMVCFSDFCLILKWWRIDGDGMGKSWGLWGYDGCSHSMMDDHIIIYGWWMMAWMMELFLEWICLNLWKGWSWTDGGLIDKWFFWPFGRGWCWGLEGLLDDVQGILGDDDPNESQLARAN